MNVALLKPEAQAKKERRRSLAGASGLTTSLAIAVVVAAVFGGSAHGGVFTGVQYAAEPSPQQYAPQQQTRPLRQSAPHKPASTWRYYPPAPESSGNREALERRQLEALRSSPSELPRHRQSTLFGHPARIDPLYEETRPDWDRQHYERPEYVHPIYDRPNEDRPLLGLDPVRLPAADRPLYVLPNDNKPNNNLKFYAAPAYDRPTIPLPVPRGPNYVIESEFAPAYGHPTYDHPYYDRPEYLGPTYEPQEYAPPQNRAPDYVAPPQ